MRALWEHHGRTGVGVPECGVEATAGQVFGLALDGFFGQALDDTTDLDLAPLLAKVGVAMHLRPANGPKYLGGVVARFTPSTVRPTLAIRLSAGCGDALVKNVLSGGAGERAGLAPGDLVVAVDGLRVTAENLERRVAAARNDTEIRLHLFRRDELMELAASPQPAAADTCELMRLDPAPAGAALAQAAWLARLA